MSPSDAPARIGPLVVEAELGAGGMGRVYRCHDAALHRDVAVKVLLPARLVDPEVRKRFLREARALAKVSSPHVVTVHGIGEDPVVGPYVVLELLQGEDLQQRLARSGQLPVDDVLRYATDACIGLQAVHDAGLVHRDIKPANLFLTSTGVVKLADFGLARDLEQGEQSSVTAIDVVVGTPAYLSPQLIEGDPPGIDSDLWALGATLYHLIAGQPPFRGDTPLAVVSAILRNTPAPLRTRVPIADAVNDAIMRMLAREPSLRPRSAVEAATLLGACTTLPPDGPTDSFAPLPSSAEGASGERPSSSLHAADVFDAPPTEPGFLAPAGSPFESTSVRRLAGPGAVDGFAAQMPPTESMFDAAATTTSAVPKRVPPVPPLQNVQSVQSVQHVQHATDARPATTTRVETGAATGSSRMTLWTGLAVGAVIVVALLVVASMRDGRRERIAAGQAQQVVEEIAAMPEARRTGADLVVLALARQKLHDDSGAFRALREAVARGDRGDTSGVTDEALQLAIGGLSSSRDLGAVDVLAAWPTRAPEEQARTLLSSEGFALRHHALEVLQARRAADDDACMQVALLDVQSSDCDQRRAGVLLLREHGRGPQALSAVQALGRELFGRNLCMLVDAPLAEAAIRGRGTTP